MLQDGGNDFLRFERARARRIDFRQNRCQPHRGIIEGKHRQQRKVNFARANVEGACQRLRLCIQFAVRIDGSLRMTCGSRREQNRRRIFGTDFGLERAGKVAFRKFSFQTFGQKKSVLEVCKRL